MTVRWLAIGSYAYSALDILTWWARLSSNGHEPWDPWLKAVSAVLVPIDLIVMGLCRVAWGSSNVFEAKPIVGLFEDVALASLLSATLILGILVAVKRGYRATAGRPA